MKYFFRKTKHTFSEKLAKVILKTERLIQTNNGDKNFCSHVSASRRARVVYHHRSAGAPSSQRLAARASDGRG